jgi:hypothetical protein
LLGALLLAGCAQTPGPQPSNEDGKVPSFIASDRWQTGASDNNTSVASVDRAAKLFLACSDGRPLMLLVSPQHDLPIDSRYRPVTIIVDHKTTFVQSWNSNKAGYGIDHSDAGFTTMIETLQQHNQVELILGRPGTDIADYSFTLNGAKATIDTVLETCGQS